MKWIILLLWGAAGAASANTILNSKHDLSVAGPGQIKAVSESEVCIFCHTPHRATELPLWNRSFTTQNYVPYSSSTAKALIGQPTGSSKLCLSCHDGTIALGMVASRPSAIEMQNAVTTLPAGRTRLGTDLSDDHPISFTFDSTLASDNGQLKDPATLTGRVRLDHNSQMQCTACHDPHSNEFGKFLVKNNTASALCLDCHAPTGWNESSHKSSPKTWNGLGQNPWPNTTETTVANNACASCHAPHNAGTPARLLNLPGEEQNCFTCHSGNVAAKNIEAEFNKLSIHPVTTKSGLHDPAEDPLHSARHAECVDCHNPHASKPGTATAPHASGALAGLTGVNSSGAIVTPLTRESELCYRCHADSPNRGPARVNRQFVETNTRLEFAPTSQSYHPVEAPGKNPNVPSLIAPWTTSSLMYCTDCHNNDQGPGAGGTGPRGPHGSIYEPLLERQLEWTDPQPESPAAYALCYKCHSRDSLLADESFSEHRRHIVDVQAACTSCHDPHGVVSQPHLINFNSTYVTNFNGILEYKSTGVNRGNCTLACHSTPVGGVTTNYYHDATSYPVTTPTPALRLQRQRKSGTAVP